MKFDENVLLLSYNYDNELTTELCVWHSSTRAVKFAQLSLLREPEMEPERKWQQHSFELWYDISHMDPSMEGTP